MKPKSIFTAVGLGLGLGLVEMGLGFVFYHELYGDLSMPCYKGALPWHKN